MNDDEEQKIDYYFDRKGNPLSLEEWADLFKDKKYHAVCQEYIGKYYISTIWLGVNYNFYEGDPIIFETMVFANGSWSDLDMKRYSTEEEALEGHREMCEKFKEMVDDE